MHARGQCEMRPAMHACCHSLPGNVSKIPGTSLVEPRMVFRRTVVLAVCSCNPVFVKMSLNQVLAYHFRGLPDFFFPFLRKNYGNRPLLIDQTFPPQFSSKENDDWRNMSWFYVSIQVMQPTLIINKQPAYHKPIFLALNEPTYQYFLMWAKCYRIHTKRDMSIYPRVIRL